MKEIEKPKRRLKRKATESTGETESTGSTLDEMLSTLGVDKLEMNFDDPDFIAPVNTKDPILKIGELNPFYQEFWARLQGKTEANAEMVLSAVLAGLAGACGNRVILKGQNLCPNLYILMIGPSSTSKKSTSMKLGLDPLKKIANKIHQANGIVLAKYEEDMSEYKAEKRIYDGLSKKEMAVAQKPVAPEKPELNNNSPIYADETTPEQLIEILEKKPDGIFTYHEFGKLLASFSNKYMTGFKEKITEFYDGTDEYYSRQTKERRIQINNARLSIIGCSTAQWLHKHLNSEDAESGFLARFMIVFHKEKPDELIAWPIDTSATKEQVELFMSIIAIEELELLPDKEAYDFYDAWYKDFSVNVIYKAEEMYRPFLSRMTVMAHKIAMINHVLTCLRLNLPINSKITKQSYLEAIPWIVFSQECLYETLGDMITTGNAIYRKMLGLLEEQGIKFKIDNKQMFKLTRKKLHKLLNCTKKEYEEALDTLSSQGLITIDNTSAITYIVRKGTINR